MIKQPVGAPVDRLGDIIDLSLCVRWTKIQMLKHECISLISATKKKNI